MGRWFVCKHRSKCAMFLISRSIISGRRFLHSFVLTNISQVMINGVNLIKPSGLVNYTRQSTSKHLNIVCRRGWSWGWSSGRQVLCTARRNDSDNSEWCSCSWRCHRASTGSGTSSLIETNERKGQSVVVVTNRTRSTQTRKGMSKRSLRQASESKFDSKVKRE